ncbi:hypothetical protein PR202_gb16861 [Eleusine coracana subsp. coracana]|uniref:Uncharacterized protein n=1 Tax=Eleusine coracana subsp. coracana TaxID=191504 RepID=A0AAV5EZ56_ELECO|nr:hypothetical protein PR202_gb16861 [Eleusine coracana subsp. coracana]
MPPKVEEGRPGATGCLWLVTVLLLISLLAGGACLVSYILLPPRQAPAWLPAVGLVLVALPWGFWIVTCMYRCAKAEGWPRWRRQPPACALRATRRLRAHEK